MPRQKRQKEKQVPVAEYLGDAIDHIKRVAGKVQRAIKTPPRLKLGPREKFRVFGRGCEVKAIPLPLGGGCGGPEDIRGRVERESARRTMRRSSRARKRVKR